MRKISGILSIMSLWMLTSCMAMDPSAMGTYTINMNGIVTDEADNPIEHIKVRLEWDSPFSPIVVYSSANGIFSADLDFYDLTYPVTIAIELSDTDGEANGGEFESKTDEITILEEGPPTPITYRLSLSTASESSPQSL